MAKKKSKTDKFVKRCYSVPPLVAAFLADLPNASAGMSAIVVRSAAYKKWKGDR